MGGATLPQNQQKNEILQRLQQDTQHKRQIHLTFCCQEVDEGLHETRTRSQRINHTGMVKRRVGASRGNHPHEQQQEDGG